MASSYSQYKIELQVTGENSGTWGTITNANFGSATPGVYQGFEQAIGGRADVTMSTTTVTLTLTNTNAAQDARALYLNLSGTPGGAADLVVPALQKAYLVKNGTNAVVTIKVTGQTGVPIPVGRTVWVYNNGTDVVTAVDHIPSLTLGAALPVASGGSGATTLTGVLKGNGTSAFTAGNVNLASEVTGTLPVGNGGTGITSFGTGVATALGQNVTGSGGIALATSPSFTTPTLGAASATSVAFGAGAVGTPAITTTGDLNTGIYFPAADTIAFTEGGAEAMRIDSFGNVGIGTTSPAHKLDVNGQVQAKAQFYLTDSSSNDILRITEIAARDVRLDTFNGTDFNGTLRIAGQLLSFETGTGGAVSERMRITSSGNVGIGTSSPTTRLEAEGVISAKRSGIDQAARISSDGGNTFIDSYNNVNTTDVPMLFRQISTSGTTERMRIDSSGNVGIGTSSNLLSDANRTTVSVNGTNSSALAFGVSGALKSYIFTDTNHLELDSQTGYIQFNAGSAERMRIDTSGNVLVGITTARANAGDVQVSKGISFPATQSAQSDANTLDDYEEGTWTPTLTTSNSNGTYVYAIRQGKYTKIGNTVVAHVYIQLASSGNTAGTGGLRVSGLPFQAGDANSGAAPWYNNGVVGIHANITPGMSSSLIVEESTIIDLRTDTGGYNAAGMENFGLFSTTIVYQV